MILNADARRIPLADESVQMCMTSPPYFAVRDYGVAGAIGNEQTLDEYLAELRVAFGEVWRVLRKDGTLWLNLGDTYAESGKGYSRNGGSYGGPKQLANTGSIGLPRTPKVLGTKPKDLLGVPWRVALALQADGWYLRSDIIWHKPNPMPESQIDRPTRAHEYLFLLAKSDRYFFDHVAIQEPAVTGAWDAMPPIGGTKKAGGNGHSTYSGNTPASAGWRNRRDVWMLSTAGFRGPHFAAFPEELVEPCVLAGTSAAGNCEQCGAPYKRETIKVPTGQMQKRPDGLASYPGSHRRIHKDGREQGERGVPVTAYETTGWKRTCRCKTEWVRPAVVLDPFCGSGTTGVVCRRFGRRFVGMDLSMKYLRDLAYPRAETGQLALGGVT